MSFVKEYSIASFISWCYVYFSGWCALVSSALLGEFAFFFPVSVCAVMRCAVCLLAKLNIELCGVG